MPSMRSHSFAVAAPALLLLLAFAGPALASNSRIERGLDERARVGFHAFGPHLLRLDAYTFRGERSARNRRPNHRGGHIDVLNSLKKYPGLSNDSDVSTGSLASRKVRESIAHYGAGLAKAHRWPCSHPFTRYFYDTVKNSRWGGCFEGRQIPRGKATDPRLLQTSAWTPRSPTRLWKLDGW